VLLNANQPPMELNSGDPHWSLWLLLQWSLLCCCAACDGCALRFCSCSTWCQLKMHCLRSTVMLLMSRNLPSCMLFPTKYRVPKGQGNWKKSENLIGWGKSVKMQNYNCTSLDRKCASDRTNNWYFAKLQIVHEVHGWKGKLKIQVQNSWRW